MKNTPISMNAISENITYSEAVEEFLTHKKVMGCSPKTIDNYKVTSRQFAKVFPEDSPCKNIIPPKLDEYVLMLQETNNSVSVRTYMRTLKTILRYFMKRGYIEEFEIVLPAQKKIPKTLYTYDELKSLLKKPEIKKCDFVEYRNWAMINFIYATGVRARTLVNIKIEDINFDGGSIILKEVKNGKPFAVPLSQSTNKLLQEYLIYRKGGPEDYLFCNTFGEQLTTDALKRAIRRYNHSRGVLKTSVHLLRHNYATEYLRNGGDIYVLQKLLGHSTLAMVLEYAQVTGINLKNNYDKLNPLDRFNKENGPKTTVKMKSA